MKITFTHKNKSYSVSYRKLNENEPLQANGIRMFLHGCLAKYEPDLKKVQEEMNKNDFNIEIYKVELSE